MAEPEEQADQLIPETEAAPDADQRAEEEEVVSEETTTEKPDEDAVDDEAAVTEEGGAEPPAAQEPEYPAADEEQEAADQQQQLEAEEQPQLLQEEYPETPAEGEMAETTLEDATAAAAEPEEPQVAAAGDADIDEPAIIEPEDEGEKEPLTDMQALEENLTKFRHCIENIGTQLDDELNRQDMRKLRASIREKATRMENDLKERQKTKDQLDPKGRIQLQQVIKQLDTQLTTYHELLERERAMTRRHPLVGVNLEKEGRVSDEAATPGQAQAMLKASVRDRECELTELGELERDIIGLQDIQTDLATLIGEQADDIKLIEQNVERAGDRVEHGQHQMKQSVDQQRASRKMLCVVLTCASSFAAAVIILLVIVMAVILTQQ